MNKTLNFHQINDRRWFDNTICWLESRYEFIAASDLNESSNNGTHVKNTCHITIDDGDISFYNIIFPVLKKYRIPATLFVSPKVCRDESNYWFQEINAFDQAELKRVIASVTGIPVKPLLKSKPESILKSMRIARINEIIHKYRKGKPSLIPFQNITARQLKEIDKSGLVTIGAHTLNHPILKNENDADSYNEISKSIDELSDMLDHEIRYFAYPNGIPSLDYTEREKDYLRKCGINLSFKNESEDNLTGKDPMSMPRIAISDNESMNYLNLKLNFGRYWYLIKKLSLSGEFQERKRLSKIFH